MWRVQYVSAQQLAGFRQYKYSVVDTNPLSVHVLQPMWDQIVKIVPQWVAPNLLTFSGFVMLLINYFLLSFYDWDYTASGTSPGSIPTWVWLFSAFATLCAYTLDSIDGKHARRTQCSTPLGELFDHGLDSWATSIFIFNFFSLCSRGNEQTGFLLHKMFLSLNIGLLNFMVSHWEKYNTGVLFLPWGYDISQVVQIVLYLLTAAAGVEIWHRPILFGYYIVDILIPLVVGLSIVLSFPQSLYNIYKAYLKKTLKKDSFYDGCIPLVSPILLFTLISIWVTLSPYNILAKETRMFFWMFGVTFSNILVRMIICQMSNTRPKVFHWFLFPLALVVYTAVTGQLGRMEPMVLALFNVFVTAAHVHYGICVVRQLSDYFNIYTFSLKKRIRE